MSAPYLLYNGILKDKRPTGGNVLTTKILDSLEPHDGPKVIYGERTMFGDSRLKSENITFKLTPYHVKGR
jgi:adenine-specific DNA-methyltransferase